MWENGRQRTMFRKTIPRIVLVLMVTSVLTLTFSARAVVPTIDIILPQSYPAYYTNPVPLNFTIDESTWIGCSVDGQGNETILGNTTIAWVILDPGEHNIILYANDTSGDMGSSATIYFNVTYNTDVTLDGKVRIDDALMAAEAFGCYLGYDGPKPRWNPLADVNGDNMVRVDDILAVALDFGKTLS